MKIPFVEPYKNLDELIEVVGNPEKFLDRLKQLQNLQDFINGRLADLGTSEEISALYAQASSHATEAADLRKAAVQELADAQAEASALRAAAKTEIDDTYRSLGQERESLAVAKANTESEKQAALEMHNVAVKATEEAAQTMDRAQKMMDDAVELKNRFQDKLKQLQAVTA
jgi:hypothetical protein